MFLQRLLQLASLLPVHGGLFDVALALADGGERRVLRQREVQLRGELKSLAGEYDSPDWSLGLTLVDVGAAFNPEVGFLNRSGGYQNLAVSALRRIRFDLVTAALVVIAGCASGGLDFLLLRNGHPRNYVRWVAAALAEADPNQAVVVQSIRRDKHSPRRVYRNLDLGMTVRRNLKNYDADRGKLLVDRLFFFAAERNMLGPPISMFSMAMVKSQVGLAIVCSNGYKLTMSKSMG